MTAESCAQSSARPLHSPSTKGGAWSEEASERRSGPLSPGATESCLSLEDCSISRRGECQKNNHYASREFGWAQASESTRRRNRAVNGDGACVSDVDTMGHFIGWKGCVGFLDVFILVVEVFFFANNSHIRVFGAKMLDWNRQSL